jgi:hypothetical protein
VAGMDRMVDGYTQVEERDLRIQLTLKECNISIITVKPNLF